MKMRPVHLLAALTLWLVAAWAPHTAQAQARKPIVAVFDIEARRVRLASDVLSVLSDYLATSLTATGRYQVVPRDQLKKRLVQQKKKSFRNCYAQSCQIEIGKELAANKILATQVMKIGKLCVVSATVYDLKKATMERGATAEGKCDEQAIMTSLKSVVSKLAGRQVSPSARAPQVEAPPPSRPAVVTLKRTKPRRKRSVATLRVLCREGSAPECTNLGYKYEFGKGVPRYLTRAVALYLRACNDKDAAGCTNLGYMYRVGRGVPKRHATGARYYRKGCNLGSARGCTNLGYLCEIGEGVPKRLKLAVFYYGKGCQAGSAIACTNLGYMYKSGRGIARNYARAAELYRKGCSGGNARGCARYDHPRPPPPYTGRQLLPAGQGF